MAATSRVTAQNQISIPATVRRRFGIKPGSVLEWSEQDGDLVVRLKAKSLADVRAALGASSARLTVCQMRAARNRALATKLNRGRR